MSKQKKAKTMKMNNKILSIASAMALGLTFSSCTDKQDWSTDSSTDRLFRSIGGVEVTPEETKAYVEFKTVPNATHYIIEVSKDSLHDGVAQGASATSVIYGADKSIVKSDTIRNLDGDTRYYLRMKSVSDSKESKWVYFKTSKGLGYFKTKAEQLFNPVADADRLENSIRLTWTTGAQVTSIAVYKSSERVDSILLDATAIANAEYTVTGLLPATNYRFIIYNNELKRGELTVATPAAMPAADYKYMLPTTVDAITSDLLNDIATEAKAVAGSDTYSATIGIPADSNIDFYGSIGEDGKPTSLKLPEGMSVTFFGLAGGSTPNLAVKNTVNLAGAHTYVNFENVNLIADGSDYVINQDGECILEQISFKDCNISGFKNDVIRFKGGTPKVTNLIVENCIINNIGNGNYAVFYFNNKDYTVSNIEIKNSTFYNINSHIINCPNAVVNNIDITSCTFYNTVPDTKYVIDANNNSTVEIKLTKLIFTKAYNASTEKWPKGIRGGSVAIDDVYFTNDFALAGNKFEPTGTFDYSSSDLFTDPDNGDFTLKKDLNVGDPRWFREE